MGGSLQNCPSNEWSDDVKEHLSSERNKEKQTFNWFAFFMEEGEISLIRSKIQ